MLGEAFLYTVGLLFQQVCTFLGTVVSARWLGPVDYGILSLTRNIFSVLLLLAPLGLDLSLQRHLSDPSSAGSIGAQVLYLRRLVFAVNCGVTLFVCVLATPFLTVVYGVPGAGKFLALTALSLPLAADIALLGAVFRTLSRVTLFAAGSLLIQPFVRLVALVGLLWGGQGLTGAILANLIGYAASSAYLAFAYRKLVPSSPVTTEARRSASSALALGRPMAASLLLYGMLRNVDVLILGTVATTSDVAHYSLMSALAQLTLILPQAMSQSIGPVIARLHWQGRRARMQARLVRHLRRTSLLAAVPCAGVAIFGPWFNLVTGPKYEFSTLVSCTLALAYYASAVWAPVGYSLSMTGAHVKELILLAAAGGVTVVLCWALGHSAGQEGVALGLLLGYVLLNASRVVLANKQTGVNVFRISQLLPIALLLPVLGACRLAIEGAVNRSLLSYGLGAGLSGALGAVLLVTLLLTHSETQRLRRWLVNLVNR